MFANVDIGTIITLVLGLIATFASTFWVLSKGKIGLIATAAKELADVGSALSRALEDDKITKEEIQDIKTQWLEAKTALKAIVGK